MNFAGELRLEIHQVKNDSSRNDDNTSFITAQLGHHHMAP